MSVSGIYNYHPKVNEPNKIFYQMESGEFQTPFYFGGSQVPLNLGVSIGSGIKSPYVSTCEYKKDIDLKGHGLGCGLKTTMRKNDNIRMPYHMFHK